MDRNNDKEIINPEKDYNEKSGYQDEVEEREDMPWKDELTTEPSGKENLLKRVLSGLGTGSLVVGGGIFLVILNILQFIFTAIIGLTMIWWAITEFFGGSIIVGLLVLLIGTPLAIALAHWAFFFLLFLGIFVGILWGIASLFGFSVSFWNIWDIIWLVIKILILGFIAYAGVFGFIEAIREKRISEFFKEYWWGILLFCFLFWLFFL